jgi:hypothetical protein
MTDLPLSDERIREIATVLIVEHATDVEYLTINEHLSELGEMQPTTEDEFDAVARRIDRLIQKATITVELKG